MFCLVSLYSVNEDEWTPLDMAVMLSDKIALLLMEYGAKDSNKCELTADAVHTVRDMSCQTIVP